MHDIYECLECLHEFTVDDLNDLPPNLTRGWGHICKEKSGTLCETYLSVVSEGEG